MLKPDFFYQDVPLSSTTYYKIGGKCRFYALPRTIQDAQQALYYCHAHSLPFTVLGSGSNSLYSDEYFDGVVIALSELTQWHWDSSETLFVEAGVTNTEIAEICLAECRQGAAWMYRMPGLLGGSIRMNARCYGGELSNIIQEIITLDLHGNLKTYRHQDIFLGYKKTLLMERPEIVIAAKLSFPHTGNFNEILQFMEKCESDRHKKQHFLFPSCGSTFKNNYEFGKPSGQIFDELGLKGTTAGDAEISNFHANFIWNRDHAKALDILTLAAKMRKMALDTYSVSLDLEVQPVGIFPQQVCLDCHLQELSPVPFTKEEKSYSGLFWTPFKKEEVTEFSEKTIFASSFCEYFHTPQKGLEGISVNVTQLLPLLEAKNQPKKPFLRWTTEATSYERMQEVFKLHPKKTGVFMDKLWEYSVSEAFFAHPQKKNHYLECEVSLEKNWLALAFVDIRQRKQENIIPEEKLWPGITIQSEKKKEKYLLHFFIPFSILEPYIAGNSILMQCALSLGEQKYYLAPYWHFSTLQKKENKPDFHQPERFCEFKLY